MAGRLLPAFPQGRALPWVLGGVSIAVLAVGAATGDSSTIAIGAVGLAGCVIAFPLSRVLLGSGPSPGGEPIAAPVVDPPPSSADERPPTGN